MTGNSGHHADFGSDALQGPERHQTADDAALAPFFAALRAAPAPALARDFEARLRADAMAMRPAAAVAAPPAATSGAGAGPGRLLARLSGFLNGLGGMPSLAGMTTAVVAGIWIGLAETGPASALTGAIWQADSGGSTADPASLTGFDWTISDAATPFDSLLPATD